MATGDHLVVQFGAYTHHGIDLGDGNVIHFGRGLHNKVNARVEIVDRSQFAGQAQITVRESAACFEAEEIVERAKSRLGETDYHLLDNNCEHFVNWCRHGVADSSQVNIVDSVCRRGSAAAAKLAFPKLASRFMVKDVAAKIASRYGLTAALAGDAVQLSAEVISIKSGKDQAQTKDIGRKSGALASGGIGYMLGGPAGAAVGFGSWLFGEVVGQTATATASANSAAASTCDPCDVDENESSKKQ